jgi:hypothetical protein
MKKFAASIPRKMYWSDKVPNMNRCPRCQAELENEYHIYVFAARSKRDFETFIHGTDHGAFCPQCPILVLDNDGFRQTMQQIANTTDWIKSHKLSIAVLGIVDMDAVPEEKHKQQLGTDDNPIPLVRFIDHIEGEERRAEIKRKGNRLSGNQRRRRNRI